ncbi:MAG: ATP-binding protein [Actinomycetia bacterium]|nr:ATP-binding protein [Actinomycetes bacterium]
MSSFEATDSDLSASGSHFGQTDSMPSEDWPSGAFNNKDLPDATVPSSGPLIRTQARIAVYDDLLSAPRIIDVEPAPLLRFIENIAVISYEHSQKQGGRIPYSVIREIAENFIHADFKECTVSVLDHGNTVRFSDQGPGIEKKLLVQQPGVTSASTEMRRYIKGVGSGFPIVREYLDINSGNLSIDDNAVEGTVITLSIALPRPYQGHHRGAVDSSVVNDTGFSGGSEKPAYPIASAGQQLSGAAEPLLVDARTVQALHTIEEIGAAGPTDLAGPLGVSAATATRVLQSLQDAGLVEKAANRKRILSNAGLQLLRRLPGR